MSPRAKVVWVCYSTVAIMALAVGLVYLLSPEIMPYHQRVLGLSWDEIAPNFQLLSLALLRGAGLAALVTGLAVGILLLIPYRRGERWPCWAIPALALTTLAPASYYALSLNLSTGIRTPWPWTVAATALVLVGLLASAQRRPAGGSRPAAEDTSRPGCDP